MSQCHPHGKTFWSSLFLEMLTENNSDRLHVLLSFKMLMLELCQEKENNDNMTIYHMIIKNNLFCAFIKT